MKTLRTDATLILSNGNGSTCYQSFIKGTPIADIAAEAARIHTESVERSIDNRGFDIYRRPRLVSQATGRPLATSVPFTHAAVAPKCNIHTLSPRMREVFVLRHMDDACIASIIGCSERAVASYRDQMHARLVEMNNASI